MQFRSGTINNSVEKLALNHELDSHIEIGHENTFQLSARLSWGKKDGAVGGTSKRAGENAWFENLVNDLLLAGCLSLSISLLPSPNSGKTREN